MRPRPITMPLTTILRLTITTQSTTLADTTSMLMELIPTSELPMMGNRVERNSSMGIHVMRSSMSNGMWGGMYVMDSRMS